MKKKILSILSALLIAVLVTTANVQDRDAALPLADLALAKVPCIEKAYVDGEYAGAGLQDIREQRHIDVEVVRHPGNRNVGRWHEGQLVLFADLPTGFVVLPKRWIIERTYRLTACCSGGVHST